MESDHIDHIIDEYRKGDADKRLSMFLHYGDHRSIFCSIEWDHPMDLDAAQHGSMHCLIESE